MHFFDDGNILQYISSKRMYIYICVFEDIDDQLYDMYNDVIARVKYLF